jgi:hypothetical protein
MYVEGSVNVTPPSHPRVSVTDRNVETETNVAFRVVRFCKVSEEISHIVGNHLQLI